MLHKKNNKRKRKVNIKTRNKKINYYENWTWISILQQGQWALFCSQGTKHLQWNLCAHGRCTRVSPDLNLSRQMVHSSCSLAFQLNLAQLNFLLDPLFFFEPNTSACNSPAAIALLSSPLKLLVVSCLNSRYYINKWN